MATGFPNGDFWILDTKWLSFCDLHVKFCCPAANIYISLYNSIHFSGTPCIMWTIIYARKGTLQWLKYTKLPWEFFTVLVHAHCDQSSGQSYFVLNCKMASYLSTLTKCQVKLQWLYATHKSDRVFMWVETYIDFYSSLVQLL